MRLGSIKNAGPSKFGCCAAGRRGHCSLCNLVQQGLWAALPFNDSLGGSLHTVMLRVLSSTLSVITPGSCWSNPAGTPAGGMDGDMREWAAPNDQICPVAASVTQGTGWQAGSGSR